MDLSEAKRILRLVADDDSSSGRAWDGQAESAKIVLSELERLEKALKDPGITIGEWLLISCINQFVDMISNIQHSCQIDHLQRA